VASREDFLDGLAELRGVLRREHEWGCAKRSYDSPRSMGICDEARKFPF
jgi:hypothetical protein